MPPCFNSTSDSVRVHQVLAEAYAQATRNQQAISELELAVKIAPRQPGLHEELADQYWVVGDLDKAARLPRRTVHRSVRDFIEIQAGQPAGAAARTQRRAWAFCAMLCMPTLR